MKKFLFSVALLMGGMAVASAQSLVLKTESSIDFIPKTCTFNNQAQAYTLSSDTISIFDENFNLVHKIPYEGNYLDGFHYTNLDSDSPTNDFYTSLSQTLFNDDDKYEVIIGNKIVSEDGSILFDFDAEISQVFIFNGNTFLSAGYALYRIDKESSSLQEVAMPVGMKMFPTIARPSDEITIEFEASAGNAVRTLSVTDAAGRTVEQRTVAPDATRIAVSARRLHAGTYIFTLTENGKQVDNGKIIVT